ncbi:MAG TPA: hypothetical protein VMA36_15355 [Candidatus Limnocylindria bacterium]|jgi:hypothetical protein|nr:hypothetical protein [Candidatus Limnocylindria bacterium]
MKLLRGLLVPVLSLAIVLVASIAALSDSTGTMAGAVTAVGDRFVEIKVDRETIRFAIGDDFSGVYSLAPKAKRSLSDLKPGMFVRVSFVKTTLGNAYRKATEIDIVTGSAQSPLPLPSGILQTP